MSYKYLDETGLSHLISRIKEWLNKKVDAETGKGLSANDFTNTLKTKLDGIESGATKVTIDNAMSTTSENPVQNKVVKAALDALTPDAALSTTSTKAVQNKVVNSALSGKAPLASPALTGTPTAPTATAGSDTTQIANTAFVKAAITSALEDVTSISFEIVTSLPAEGENGVIYLISNSGTTPNIYDEYIWLASSSTFEKIGTTDVDLSGYVQTSDLVAITTTYIDTEFPAPTA